MKNPTLLLLPLATALGAWSVALFPKPPQMLIDLAQNELIRYILLFVFIWQGGGRQNIQTAIVTTVIVFLTARFLERPQPIVMMGPPDVDLGPPVEESFY